jgi:hypothetical protein
LKPEEKKDGITLILTCSKLGLLPFFFAGLKKMDLPREQMHLLIYDNTDDENFLEALKNEIDEFFCPKCRQFKSVRLYKSYLKPKGALAGSGNEKIGASKLINIWRMWQKIYHMIYTETFFQLEDDTICPPDAFRRLWGLLMQDSRVGFATAIETGRNALPYSPVRVGLHKIVLKDGKLLKRESFDPDTQGVVEIDAAGVYCFAARTEAWKTGFIDYKPISNIFSLFAMDNVLTYNIKQHGWKLLADFDCWCDHMQVSPNRIMLFSKEQALHMVDLYVPEYDTYAVGMEIKKPNQKLRDYLIRKPAPCISLIPDEDENAQKEIRKIKKEAKALKDNSFAPKI